MSSGGTYESVFNTSSRDGDYVGDYFKFFVFLLVAACLKTIQRQIRIPYTTVVYILTTALISSMVKTSGETITMSKGFLGAVGSQAIKVFVPAFVVHTTQGINSYIFRRCHLEIIVFSIGTFSMTAVMTYLYASKRIAENWAWRETFFFALFLCSVERMPLSDVLFDEGRFPVIATMIQSEALFNTAITWFLYGLYGSSPGTAGSPNQNSEVMFTLHSQVVALFVGAVMGGVAITALRVIPFGSDSSIIVLLCATYFTYFFLESIGSSGVTGVITCTMIVNAHRLISCTELQDTLEEFIAVALLYPVMGHFGYRITVKQALVLIWMGVKGTYTMSFATLYHMSNSNIHTEMVLKSFVFIAWDMLLSQVINVSLLPCILRTLGVIEVSEVEWNTMREAVMYIQEAADTARVINHSDPNFLLADWKWVKNHTRIINPLEGSFRFHARRSKRDKRKSSSRQLEKQSETLAVENVLRIESVSFARQHREGTIQKKTMMALLAALQYPYDKKIYLDIDIINSLVDIPGWIMRIKGLIAEPTGEEDLVSDESASLSERIAKPLREKLMDLFEHEYYEMVITNTSLSFVLVLWGTLEAIHAYHEYNIWFVIALEFFYLTMFLVEVALMISAYGQKLVNLDNYNKLDLILVAICFCLFMVQSTMSAASMTQALQEGISVAYIAVVAARLVHAVKYIELIGVWAAYLLHRYLNAVIYCAYEAGHAIVTGEEEVQKNVWKFVDSPDLAMEIRSRATVNRLSVLHKLAIIQSRFPGIVVAFRSRQASTAILGDLTRQLADMQMDGLVDGDDYRLLRLKIQARHMRIIGEACSLPTSYKPIAMLRVIPWINSDIIRQFLAIKIKPVSFGPCDVIVERGEENPIILTYSGILKIEGEHEERGDGALPNSASLSFYFNEGYFVDYVASPACIGELGLITEEISITRVVAETQINAYMVPRERVIKAMEIFTRPPSFLYQIWAHIAKNIGLLILQTHPKYQTWPAGRIRRRLESFLMPNLENASKLILTPDIHDTLLIQGVAIDTESQETLTGPMYIPHRVRRLSFPGIYHHRVRPLLLIIADKRYRLPPELDWLRPCEGAEDDEGQYREYMNKEFGQQEQPQVFVEDED
ncbi:uncharacterized protein LOC135385200 isoform X2 [Ornithodoros turicata]|uniref:uncharacterized protein LOC135385200 isoform X2 n=1 Tax=Ornithodoros turicata TaxID=34597 RepID=UPI00313978FE